MRIPFGKTVLQRYNVYKMRATAKRARRVVTKEMLLVASGLCLSLFSVILILSPNTFFDFFAHFILENVGVSGFWLFLAVFFLYGVHLTFRGRCFRLHTWLTLIGLLVLIVILSTLLSYYVSLKPLAEGKYADLAPDGKLTKDNALLVFVEAILPASPASNWAYMLDLGGGRLGFMLLGLLLGIFDGVAVQVFLWLLFIAFLPLVFNYPLKLLIKRRRKRKGALKEETRKAATIADEGHEEALAFLPSSKAEEPPLAFAGPSVVQSARPEVLKEEPSVSSTPPSSSFFAQEQVVPEMPKPASAVASSVSEIRHPEPSFISSNVFSRAAPSLASDDEVRREYDEILAERSLSDLTVKSYNRTHGMVKARFDFFASEKPASSPVEEKPAATPMKERSPLFQEAVPSYTISAAQEATFSSERSEAPVSERPAAPSFAAAAPSFLSADEMTREREPVVPSPEVSIKESTPVPEVKEAGEEIKEQAPVRPPYRLPPLSCLHYHEDPNDLLKNDSSCAERTDIINTNFAHLRVGAKVVGHTIGPSVTRFDVEMDPEASVATVQRVVADLAIRLGGVPVRFEPLVLNKSTSGLEVANKIRTNVGLRESLERLVQDGNRNPLEIVFGKNISGELIHADLADFPHMLVAGTTGSGKTIFLHTVLVSLLMHNPPEDLRIIIVDPKKVEMNYYRNIPHLLCPSINEGTKAKVALDKLVDEMERRYNVFEQCLVNSIKAYNHQAEAKGLPRMPRIVVVVDEYADLHEGCKEVEGPLLRIAQKARAAGIHLIIATQRPTVDIINGTIKSNLSTHVALMVGSQVDSVTIIGEKGAEELLGNGDMLVESPLISRSSKIRVQGAFIEVDEILSVCDFIREQRPANFDPIFMDLEEHQAAAAEEETPLVLDKDVQEEELYEIIKDDAMRRDFYSISYIQRTFGTGFPKAGRLFAKLQREGIVSNVSSNAAKGCPVLIHASQLTNDDDPGPVSIDESRIIAPGSEQN